MSDNYRYLFGEVEQRLRNGSVTSQLGKLNRWQCHHLKQSLLETLTLYRSEFEAISVAKKLSYERICEELHRIVDHGECLLRDCSDEEEGLNAVIRLADQTETFVNILFELQWCMVLMRTVQRFDERGISGDLQLEILKEFVNTDWISMQKDIRRELEEAVAKDREELRHKLENLQREPQRRWNNPEQEGRVLGKLLQRLSTHADRNVPYDFLFEVQPAELENTDKLGGGSYGSVYKTTWLGESYARKQFPGKDNKSFQQEAAVLSGLCHPHVVQLFGRSVEPTCCSLVMQLMSKDLECVINTRKGLNLPFQLPVALDILLQIAEGMQYLHARKIAHRDLKPGNLLVNLVDIPKLAAAGYVHVKIADFGLAKTKDHSSTANCTNNIGTTRYMAPEVMNMPANHFTDDGLGPERRRYPLKADVYSFAITAFYILTGNEAYSEEKMAALKRLVKFQGLRPELPSAEFPQLLISLMERCWDEDACRRPSFVQICLELRHLKGLLMLGASRHQLEALRFSIHPGEEEPERASMYEAYLTAASSSCAEVTTSITRILVVGYKGADKTHFIKKLCGQDIADDDKSNPKGSAIPDMDREWRHPSLPLVFHDSKDLGHNAADIDRIAQFLKQRNKGWTYDAMQAVATKVLRRTILGQHGQDLENLNSDRIHLVWLVYPVLESPQTEWKPLMDVIRKFELPVQLLITNMEQDPSGEKLKKNYLDKRGYLFAPSIPQQQQILTVFSEYCTADTTVIEEAVLNLHQETRCLENVTAEKLWATSQVVTMKHQIQQTAKIISRLAFRLRRNGTTIASAPFTNLSREYSLSQTAIFSLKCLCKIWEVPRQMADVLFDSLVSWERDESFNRTSSRRNLESRIPSFRKMPRSNSDPIRASPADHSRQLKLEPGRFLGFGSRIASLLLFCKARHPKGWVQEGRVSDGRYSLELVNSYYNAHANFKEFSGDAYHFGVLSKIRGKFVGVSTKQTLEEDLQVCLEGFFQRVLDCSPEPCKVVVAVEEEPRNESEREPVVVGPLDGASYPQSLRAVMMAIKRLKSLWLRFWIVDFFFQQSRHVVQMCLRRSRSDSSLTPLVDDLGAAVIV